MLIEKKLNSMGVSTYEQIANWTADDIERFSRSLDFKGRIEREKLTVTKGAESLLVDGDPDAAYEVRCAKCF